jgi:hypothetical protein
MNGELKDTIFKRKLICKELRILSNGMIAREMILIYSRLLNVQKVFQILESTVQ